MSEIYQSIQDGSATDEDRKRLKILREQYIALSKEVEDMMGSLHVGHRNRKSAIAALQIGKKVLQTTQQVLSTRRQGCGEDLRVGGDEIGRRQGINELAGVEIDLASRGLVHAFDVADCRKNRLCRDEITVLHKVEDSILTPLGMLEPFIFWGIGVACMQHEHAFRGFVPDT